MVILGIESSCDETAVAIVKDGTEVLSSIVFSQIPLHQPYGGVVPEIASRSHIEKIRGVIEEAMTTAFGGLDWTQVDAIAATYGPGLAPALLVGWSAAKGLAMSTGKPLIPVHHMYAHLHAVRLDHPELTDDMLYPQLGLAVSGGHTCFIASPSPTEHHLLGQTIDDAAGEAFDKAAKALGLGYPGGPILDRLAKTVPEAQRKAIRFPLGKVSAEHPLPEGWQHDLCVSFSGLKTSLLTYLQKHPPQNDTDIAQICASYQEAIVEALALRLETALSRASYKSIALGGGVSLNGRLREALTRVAQRHHTPIYFAAPCYCGDNAAMIAGVADRYTESGTGCKAATSPEITHLSEAQSASLALDIDPSLPI